MFLSRSFAVSLVDFLSSYHCTNNSLSVLFASNFFWNFIIWALDLGEITAQILRSISYRLAVCKLDNLCLRSLIHRNEIIMKILDIILYYSYYTIFNTFVIDDLLLIAINHSILDVRFPIWIKFIHRLSSHLYPCIIHTEISKYLLSLLDSRIVWIEELDGFDTISRVSKIYAYTCS